MLWFSNCCTNPSGEALPEERLMIMERLGVDIGHVFRTNGRHLAVRSLYFIAIQVLRILQQVHAKGIIHRDIKPDNLLMGINDKVNTVHLIDFGLSKFFVNPRDNVHIPYRNDKTTKTGTPRYVSISCHMGIEQSRRDDIESLAYTLIYLWRGDLPWQRLYAETKAEMHDAILECKSSTSVEKLCEGMPREFSFLLDYSRRLKFYDEPEYDKLIQLFNEGAAMLGLPDPSDPTDTHFEWHETMRRSRRFRNTIIPRPATTAAAAVVSTVGDAAGDGKDGEETVLDPHEI